MKKFALIFGLFLSFNTNVLAENIEKDNALQQIQQLAEPYKSEYLHKEAFPKGLDNYSMYNDDIKEGNYRYHQCIKKSL